MSKQHDLVLVSFGTTLVKGKRVAKLTARGEDVEQRQLYRIYLELLSLSGLESATDATISIEEQLDLFEESLYTVGGYVAEKA